MDEIDRYLQSGEYQRKKGVVDSLIRKSGLDKPKKHLETARHCIVRGDYFFQKANGDLDVNRRQVEAFGEKIYQWMPCFRFSFGGEGPFTKDVSGAYEIHSERSYYFRLCLSQYIALEMGTPTSFDLAKKLLYREIEEIKTEINAMQSDGWRGDWERHQWRGCSEQNRRIAGQHPVFGAQFSGEYFEKNVFDEIMHGIKDPIEKAKKWCGIKKQMAMSFPALEYDKSCIWDYC